jgi:hypothetical protein
LLFGEKDKPLIHVELEIERRESPKVVTFPNGPSVDA